MAFFDASAHNNQHLMNLIDNWQTTDKETVIIAYCELKRRDYFFGQDGMNNHSTEFCSFHGLNSIDEFTMNTMQKGGFHSYQDYLISKNKNYFRTPEEWRSMGLDVTKIASAGKSIRSIFNLLMLNVATVILFFIFFDPNSGNREGMATWMIVIWVISLIIYIGIFAAIYSAGKNLEKSVKKEE